MSMETQTASGGSTQTQASGQVDQTGKSDVQSQAQKDVVSYESHKKLLDEKKRRDQEVADLRKQLEEINNSKKADEERLAIEKEDFKKLAKLREDQIKELQARLSEKDNELSGIHGSLQNGLKIRTFLSAVNGEVEEQYWGLIDTDSIVVDPETRQVDPASVAHAVAEFEKKYALVIKRKEGGKLPNDAARGSGGAAVGFEAEIRQAKTQKELDAVMIKYGKM